MEDLGREVFRTDAIIEKKASFITSRPLEWIEAIRKYVDTEHLNTRCEISRKKEKLKKIELEKISIIKTRICYNGNKEALVSVNCGNGLLRVTTLSIAEWIKNEFPKIKSFLKPCISSEISKEADVMAESVSSSESENTHQPSISIEDEESEESKVEHEKKDEKPKTKKGIEKCLSTEIHEIKSNLAEIRKSVDDIESKELWLKVEQIRNAANNIETSLSDLSKRFSDSLENTENRFVQQDNLIK